MATKPHELLSRMRATQLWRRTSFSPVQWDGRVRVGPGDYRQIYIRFRHKRLSVDVGAVRVYSAMSIDPELNEEMTDEQLRAELNNFIKLPNHIGSDGPENGIRR